MTLQLVSAGHYWTDAGAFMGVLPYFIWHDKVSTDDRQRLKMNLNLLLIQAEGRNILVDTGIGNRLSKRRAEIYNPSEFELPASLKAFGLETSDITDLILTHLHFDHAGGLVSNVNGKDVLTFPNAVCHIQRSEWDMAKNPDKLNKAAYQFEHQLALPESAGELNLLEGDVEIVPGVFVRLTGGHTAGMQIVETLIDGVPYIYAGDILPTRHHLPLAITSSYDVCRIASFAAKQMIYDKLIKGNGYLLLDHDTSAWQLPISEILPHLGL
jgi:glyoxylase-like metal-dependent hydrolase (beta-lactamase superfamily II)